MDLNIHYWISVQNELSYELINDAYRFYLAR